MTPIPISLEFFYRSGIDQVWSAITDPAQMRRWFFEQMEAFEPRVGFQTRFDVRAEEKHYMHLWKITEVVPGRRIVYTWKYEGIPGDSFVVWELSPEKDVTKLRLTLVGLETFPQDVPEFTRESCIQGWNWFLGERLKKFLDGPAA